MLEIERGEVIDRLVAICGLPASGKSTLARKLEHWRIPSSGLLPGPLVAGGGFEPPTFGL